MNRLEVLLAIPKAMEQLHEAGHEHLLVRQIGQQITSSDEVYMKRRAAVSNVLSHFGIERPELPDGNLRPGPGKMYPALALLERRNIVAADFLEAPSDKPRHRYYWLINRA